MREEEKAGRERNREQRAASAPQTLGACCDVGFSSASAWTGSVSTPGSFSEH